MWPAPISWNYAQLGEVSIAIWDHEFAQLNLKEYAFPLNNWGGIASNMTPGVAHGICLTICKLENENCYFSFYNSYIIYNNILTPSKFSVSGKLHLHYFNMRICFHVFSFIIYFCLFAFIILSFLLIWNNWFC